MKTSIISVLFLSFFILFGCGEKAKEVQQTVENLKNLSQSGNRLEEMNKRNEALRQERVKRGDTLAMDYKELQKFLPKSLSGFTAKEPEGTNLNFGETSFSSANITFEKVDNEKSQEVEIFIYDYNGAASIYSAAFAVWNMGYSFENENEYVKSYDSGIQDVYGFEKFEKKNLNAELTLGAAGRFLVTVKATKQQNTDFVKEIVKSMNLQELTKK